MRNTDPIVAIATAPGRGAVGIVRVSGRGLAPLVQAVCGRTLQPRHATYLPLTEADGRPIDQGLAIFFPAPHSYSGEDVLELQVHGGTVVLQLLLARCLAAAAVPQANGQPVLPRLRLAEPGEFTQRAFLNDKLDLAQAEAVADLIDASTEAAARSASRSLAGAFSAQVAPLREALIELRMQVEATLDFPEEDIDFVQQANVAEKLQKIEQQIQQILAAARQGALLREGIRVVIAGQPNAGKSSLLNALAGAELAIVTPIAGTTRDLVAQTIQIEGVPVHVTDTAGLRAAAEPALDEVERIGIARAWGQIETADAVLFVRDLTRHANPTYRQADAAIAQDLSQRLPPAVPVLEVWNKADLAPAAALADGVDALPVANAPAASDAADAAQLADERGADGVAPADAPPAPHHRLFISARTGAGLQTLRDHLLRIAGWQSAAEGVYMARERHLHALTRASAHLDTARQHLQAPNPALDILAEDLRLAHNALGEITGAFTPDDLLGTIFSRFCIGK